MKRLRVVFFVMAFVLMATTQSHGDPIWDKVVEDVITTVQEFRTVTDRIEAQSPDIWGFAINDDYIPQRGGIKVCKAENTVIVGFYLSQKNMNFYKQTFSDGQRKPLGFEMVIVDYDNVFRRGNLSHYTPGPGSEVLNEVGIRYNEVYTSDTNFDRYSLCIADPTRLQVNKWYTVEFHFYNHREFNGNATFEVRVQLVGDLYKLSKDYPDLYNQYTDDVTNWTEPFFWITINYWDTFVNTAGWNHFNVRNPAGSKFKAFHFFGWPEGEDGYDRYLWNNEDDGQRSCGNNGGQVCDYKPYYCDFGSDPWESGGDDDNSEDSNGDNSGGSGGDGGSGGGSGENYDPGDEGQTLDGPDANVANGFRVRPVGGSWQEINFTAQPGQQLEASWFIKNKGDETIDYFENY